MQEKFLEFGLSLIPVALTFLICFLLLTFAHRWLLGDKSLSASAKFSRQLILLLCYLIATLAVVISLPVETDTRNHILALLGILLSGVIAFSSTSMVANIMAGLVFKITQPFRTGDFVRVGDYFGRVTERGIFDTELQTEQRELLAFTNSYLLSQPIQVVRSSGTIISANLSLGYDVSRQKVEKQLLQAANECQLEDPFVQILELGDFSIVYRVSGLLKEVKSMISARSKLNGAILDSLHAAKIEIVSPNFMNTRNVSDNGVFIPKAARVKEPEPAKDQLPEDIVFDKAEQAEQSELQELQLREKITAMEASLKEAEADKKEQIQNRLDKLKAKLAKLIEQKGEAKGT